MGVDISQERVKELLTYDPNTGFFTWKVMNSPTGTVGSKAGTITQGYRMIGIDGSMFRASRLAFLYMEGYTPENHVDHINRVRDDDRWCNLRHVTQSCNMRNVGNRKDNKSGVKGVTWDKKVSKWLSRITVNNKMIFVGLHKSLDNAACARLAAEQCLDWSGCDSSSPAYKYVKENILCPT